MTGVPEDVPTTGPDLRDPAERPPPLPPEARAEDSAGAAAFAGFFLKTLDWGIATTSSTYLVHYLDPACEQCQQIKNGLDSTAAQGWHFVGGRYTVTAATITGGGTANPTVRVSADIAASATVDSSGAEQNSAAAEPGFSALVSLSWRSSGWLVVAFQPSGSS